MPGRNYIAGQLLSLLSLPQFSPPRKFHQFDVSSMTKGVNASGLNPLSALQRVVTIAKLTTLLSAALTILCAVVIVGAQVTVWIRTGIWESYRLGSVVRSLKAGDADVYVTASTPNSAPKLTTTQVMVDWLLEIPTTPLLMVVVALHLAFYLYLVAIDAHSDDRDH
jgi:hypothetical protein